MSTILLIEDDPYNVQILTLILTRRGRLQVKHTESGDEAMQLAALGEVDLILMDVSLCRSFYQGQSINGIALTQVLKQNPQTAHLPVVLVTGHAMEGDRENLLSQSGADDYIAKPIVDHQAFVDQIRALLSSKCNR